MLLTNNTEEIIWLFEEFADIVERYAQEEKQTADAICEGILIHG